MEQQQQKIILGIELNDRNANIYYYNDRTTYPLQKNIPLFMGFTTGQLFICEEKAFTESIYPIPLMKPEEEIKKYIEKRDNTPVTLPFFQHINPDLLWRIALLSLIQKGLDKAKDNFYEVGGIVISIPDLIPSSLKNLIIKAIFVCQLKYPTIKMSLAKNSLASGSYILNYLIRGMTGDRYDIYNTMLMGVLYYGFDSTEFYLMVIHNNEAVIVGKGSVTIGISSILKVISNIIENGTNSNCESDRDKLNRRITKELIDTFSMFSSSNIEELRFTSTSSDQIPIKREFIEELTEKENETIVQMVEKTIYEGIQKLNKMNVLEVNGTRINVNNLKVKQIIFTSEMLNHIIIKKLENKGYEVFNTNDGSQVIAKGVSILSHAMMSRFFNKNNSKGRIEEMSICEILEKNQFQLIDKNGNVINSFPKERMLSNEMIPIDISQLKTTEFYFIVENGYVIGRFQIQRKKEDNCNYYVIMNDYLNPLFPRGDEKPEDGIWKEINGNDGFYDFEKETDFIYIGKDYLTNDSLKEAEAYILQKTQKDKDYQNFIKQKYLISTEKNKLIQKEINQEVLDLQYIYENDGEELRNHFNEIKEQEENNDKAIKAFLGN